MSFTLFGIQITSYQDLVMEVKHQAAKALRISGCLNDTIWNNKHIRKEAKVPIYKSVVRPILTYAAQTRPETAKTTQTLESAEMRTLTRILI